MTMTAPNKLPANKCPLTGGPQNYSMTIRLNGMTAKELHQVKAGILKTLEVIGSDDIECRLLAFNANG